MVKHSLIFLFLLGSTVLQFNFSQELSESFLRENAKLIINTSKTCVLSTIGDDGSPSSRVMDPYIPKNDFIVYLVTNPYSRKVNEIKNDPRVALTFKNVNGYVTINGLVSIVNNLIEKKNFWKDDWTPYYESKEDALILKVTPLSIEIINPDVGISGNLKTWSPPKVSF